MKLFRNLKQIFKKNNMVSENAGKDNTNGTITENANSLIKKISVKTKTDQKELNFRKLFDEGNEGNFLIEETAKRDNDLRYYAKLMNSCYKEEEILKLMKTPFEFFNRGWFFPDKNWTSFSILWLTHDAGTSYSYNNFLPDEFWEKPELVKNFIECADNYWLSITSNNKPSDKLDYYQLGFKIQLIHTQLQTIQRLQEKFTKFALRNEKFSASTPKIAKAKFNAYRKRKKEFYTQIKALENIPLFTKTPEESKKLYAQVRDYANRDKRGLIEHSHEHNFE